MLRRIWHPSLFHLYSQLINTSPMPDAQKVHLALPFWPLSLSTALSQHIHFTLQHQQHCWWFNTKPTSLNSHHVSFVFFLVYSFLSVRDFPFSSLFLSKANSTSTGQLDKLVSPGFPALTPESEEERSLPPQRVSTFRPRPYSMADSNKVRNMKPLGEGQELELMCSDKWPSLLLEEIEMLHNNGN